MKRSPWPACSLDILPIEQGWDFLGRCPDRDLSLAASKDELWLRMQAIWNFFPQEDLQSLFESMPRWIAALIAARGGYTKH